MRLFDNFWRRWWFLQIVVGILLRLFLAATTLHSDLWALVFSSHLLAYKGILNIYDFLTSLPSGNNWYQLFGPGVFTYPPVAYFTLGGFLFLLRPLVDLSFLTYFINHPPVSSLGNSGLYYHLLIFKLPYLFFDLGLAYFLCRLFPKEEQKKTALLFWLFNPLSLYTSFMVGQFDIIPVFFVVLSQIGRAHV